jgi:iron-sulfur cluster repair protein YtfE (RIC family)
VTVEYTVEFESDVEALEDAAIRLAESEADGESDPQLQSEFAAVLDHVLNTYAVDYESLTTHVEAVARIWRTRDHESTASKHVDTVHQAFMAEICDDYDPVY